MILVLLVMATAILLRRMDLAVVRAAVALLLRRMDMAVVLLLWRLAEVRDRVLVLRLIGVLVMAVAARLMAVAMATSTLVVGLLVTMVVVVGMAAVDIVGGMSSGRVVETTVVVEGLTMVMLVVVVLTQVVVVAQVAETSPILIRQTSRQHVVVLLEAPKCLLRRLRRLLLVQEGIRIWRSLRRRRRCPWFRLK